MTNLTKRLLLFIIGVPTLALIIFFPFGEYNIAFNILLLVIISLSQREMRNLGEKALGEPVSRVPIILTPIYITLTYLSKVGLFPLLFASPMMLFAVALGCLTLEECFREDGNYDHALRRMITALGMLVYPTIISISLMEFSFGPFSFGTSFHLLYFFLLVFANDSFAYVFGLTLGKGNRGIFKPSPKKSVAGLVGGVLGTIVVAYVFGLLIFPIEKLYGEAPPMWFPAVLGFCIAISSVLGDLFASLLKRAAGVKDSGVFFPGRGGILDTIDSILFSGPLYYILMASIIVWG